MDTKKYQYMNIVFLLFSLVNKKSLTFFPKYVKNLKFHPKKIFTISKQKKEPFYTAPFLFILILRQIKKDGLYIPSFLNI